MATFGERLRTLRLQAELSQQALGQRCGASQSAISEWEADRGTPSPATVRQLCNALGVTADYLLGHADSPEGPPLSHKHLEVGRWTASFEEAVVVPAPLAVTGLAEAGSLALLTPLREDELAPSGAVPCVIIGQDRDPVAIGLAGKDAAGTVTFRRPPAHPGPVPEGELYRIARVAVTLPPGSGATDATPRAEDMDNAADQRRAGVAQPETAYSAFSADPYRVYRQAELVAALARSTGIPADHLAAVIEAVRAEGAPPQRPGVVPGGLVLQWGIDLRESALWDALLTAHVRPLAALTSIPIEVLSALVLALFRHYDERQPSDLVSQAEAGRMMGVSREYIRQLVQRGILRPWDVDGKQMVRMRDVGILASRREQGKTTQPAAAAPGGLPRRPAPLRVIRRGGKGTRDAAGEP